MMVISVIVRIIGPSCQPWVRRVGRMGRPVCLPVPALGLGRSRRILSRAGMPGGGRNVRGGSPWGVMAGSSNVMVKGSAVLCRIAFTRWVIFIFDESIRLPVEIQGLTGSLPCI